MMVVYGIFHQSKTCFSKDRAPLMGYCVTLVGNSTRKCWLNFSQQERWKWENGNSYKELFKLCNNFQCHCSKTYLRNRGDRMESEFPNYSFKFQQLEDKDSRSDSIAPKGVLTQEIKYLWGWLPQVTRTEGSGEHKETACFSYRQKRRQFIERHVPPYFI